MQHVTAYHYSCLDCAADFPADDPIYTCPGCGANLDVVLPPTDATPASIRSSADQSLWRYAPLLPVAPPPGPRTPLHTAGWTPVYRPARLESALGLTRLYVKDEGRNPTASFKDRASAVVVARALELGVETIVTASSGNAGAALAGMAAAVGARTVILVPRSAPPAKIAQLLVFGARVILVDGTYDQAFELTLEAAGEFGWYNRNTGYNPFTIEGKKTAAFEIWEQLGPELEQPERPLQLFVSVGDGNIIAGIHKGFRELHALGWLHTMPRLFGIQAEGSAAIANAFRAGTEEIRPVTAHTLADSISVGLPRDGLRALRAAIRTGGAYITVSDEAILRAITDLGGSGIFAEPAGAASYAGLVQALAEGRVDPALPVLVVNTGSGLKDTAAAMKAAGQAPVIPPSLRGLKLALGL